MSSLDKLKDYFSKLPEVKRIHELETYIDNSKIINEKFDELKSIQKLMVSSLEFNQKKQTDERSKSTDFRRIERKIN